MTSNLQRLAWTVIRLATVKLIEAIRSIQEELDALKGMEFGREQRPCPSRQRLDLAATLWRIGEYRVLLHWREVVLAAAVTEYGEWHPALRDVRTVVAEVP